MNAEHEEQRQRLLTLKESIARRLSKIDNDIHRREGALEQDSQEQAMQVENDETLDALDLAARAELKQIDQALKQMEGGSYGTCRECGGAIGSGRLEALPFAIQCVACAEKAERV